jgi:Leucine-rich repeat (LRR) protein
MRKTLKQYGGNMAEAQRRVDAWVTANNVDKVLSFYNLKLTKLPKIPDNLKKLYCDNNKLTSLPTLPNGLEILYCDINKLTSLPTLPNTLKNLHCSHNKLTSLPTLPNGLENLYCSHNKLTSLPTLPNGLEILYSSHNKLTSLATLPHSLQSLTCENNNLPEIYYREESENIDNDGTNEVIRNELQYIDRIRKLQKSRKNLTHNLTSHITEKKRLAFGNRPHKVLPTNVKRHISKYLNEDNLKNEDVHLYPTNIVSNIKRNNWRKTHKK